MSDQQSSETSEAPAQPGVLDLAIEGIAAFAASTVRDGLHQIAAQGLANGKSAEVSAPPAAKSTSTNPLVLLAVVVAAIVAVGVMKAKSAPPAA